MKYYPIDEDAARRAKDMNSLSDYAEGSATDEYRREVNRAATLAEECKKGKTDAQQEKIDYLLDRYARYLYEMSADSPTLPIALEMSAGLLGAGERQLQRVLRTLAERGIIERTGRTLTVLDRDGLKRLAGDLVQ